VTDRIGKEILDRRFIAVKGVPIIGEQRRTAVTDNRVDREILLQKVPTLPLPRICKYASEHTDIRALVRGKTYVRDVGETDFRSDRLENVGQIIRVIAEYFVR